MPLSVAQQWFSAMRIAPETIMIREPHVHSLLQANIFIIEGSERDMIVDTGMGIAPLKPFADTLRSDADKPIICVSTHTHIDHIGGVHEFDARLVHPLESVNMAAPTGRSSLFRDDMPQSLQKLSIDAGYPPLDELVINALPHAGYDPRSYKLNGAEATGLLEEGDYVDLGDKSYRVLHLPGHSPGGIGLFNEKTGVLFSGDAIYDGPLIYQGAGMSISDYISAFAILKETPVSLVHGGHDPSFGAERMNAIIDDYLARWDAR